MYCKNSKGFTLMELVMGLGIGIVVLAAVGSFLLSNYKSYNKSQNVIEAQNDAQKAMSMFVDKVIATKGISGSSLSIVDIDGTDLKDAVTNDKNIATVVFDTLGGSTLTCNFTGSTLVCGRQTVDHITGFRLEPLGGKAFPDTRGLKVTIISQYANTNPITLQNEVYFRN